MTRINESDIMAVWTDISQTLLDKAENFNTISHTKLL